ncbi:MAG: RluA family pseudouridine synthase [Phycisphaerae bacterium]|nr:RluA family pseudouridine synthase [Phycisphaerae bacterium]
MRSNKIEILLEDDDLVAVNKPAGLLTVQGRNGGISLRDVIGSAAGVYDFLLLVHRLDRQTSGVLLLAKTKQAQQSLQMQFQERQVHKEYLAIVHGQPVEDHGTIQVFMAPHPRVTGKMMVKGNKSQKGKSSKTDWEVVERFPGAALLRCIPFTGRQHQIRVHLAHIGLPLLVDRLYSETEQFCLSELKPRYRASGRHEERPLIDRLTLHAHRLRFAHPRDGRSIQLEAPLPKDFRATLDQLRKL